MEKSSGLQCMRESGYCLSECCHRRISTMSLCELPRSGWSRIQTDGQMVAHMQMHGDVGQMCQILSQQQQLGLFLVSSHVPLSKTPSHLPAHFHLFVLLFRSSLKKTLDDMNLNRFFSAMSDVPTNRKREIKLSINDCYSKIFFHN